MTNPAEWLFNKLYPGTEHVNMWSNDTTHEIYTKYLGEEIGGLLDNITRRMYGQNSYEETKALDENDQYWEDYERNTGTEPKYPIRTGANANIPAMNMPSLTGEGISVMKKLYGQ